jgi:DNA transformation protein
MSTSQDFLDFLLEQLAPLGPVAARRMFGGAGLFLDGLMFALIIDEVLYWKTDALTRADFDAESLAPFTYTRQGDVATLTNYRRAPERLLARSIHHRASVTETELTNGQESRDDRSRTTGALRARCAPSRRRRLWPIRAERLDAAIRQFRPALWVARGGPPGSSRASTVRGDYAFRHAPAGSARHRRSCLACW